MTHPAKQGLVQTLSVYIDTLLLCTATALMCLSSGVERSEAVSGAPYVQNALSTVFGRLGPIFITAAMVLFAFTTLIGNLYYVDNALIYMNGKKRPGERFMKKPGNMTSWMMKVSSGSRTRNSWNHLQIT